jgi:CheY-like chemotaxis protein
MMGGQRRILIIDDNVGLAENIAEILQIDGHLTDVASSGEAALTRALETAPDVIVTDYRLPGINGADLVRQLRQKHGPLNSIVISAYSDDQTIEDARDAGASFVSKPLDFRILGRLVLGRALSA